MKLPLNKDMNQYRDEIEKFDRERLLNYAINRNMRLDDAIYELVRLNERRRKMVIDSVVDEQYHSRNRPQFKMVYS